MKNQKEHVRIRLNSSQRNQAEGFYLLVTSGNTFSDKANEFVVERRLLDILNRNDIKFNELPLKGR